MRKIIFIIILLLIVTLISCNNSNNNDSIIKLNDKYYDNEIGIVEIDTSKLDELEDNKENFILFVFNNICYSSIEFEKVLQEFCKTYNISIYKLIFSEIKNTNIKDEINYYPSIAIFKEGKGYKYLKADKDSDVEYYKDLISFIKWISKYVYIDDSVSKEKDNNEEDDVDDTITIKNSKVEDIIYEEGKVNIYFFWGNGCPHCKYEYKFFQSLSKEYTKLFNLYCFEVWYNDDNKLLFDNLALITEVEQSGVPYTIIGRKVIVGYNSDKNQNILNYIIEESNKDYDVYKKYLEKIE